MALPLLPTNLETHPTGTLNPNGIINGNWLILNNIFDPTHVGPQAGVLEAALAGMTTITYAGSVNVDLSASRRMNVISLAGALAVAVTNKAAGRSRRLVLVGDGTDRAISWPAGAVWSGPALTTVQSGKTAVVEILSTTTADSGLVLESVASEAIVTLNGTQTLTNKSLTSPALTGTPTAPTATPGDNTTAVATTAFVTAAVSGAGFATLTGAETLTNKTITSGKFNQLNDTGGNEALIFTATASAVNELTIANAATGNAPSITASGADTNIGILISGKGTGAVTIPKAALTASKLALHADAYVEVTASRAITDADNGKILWSASGSDYTLTYPDTLTLPHSSAHQQRAAGALITAVSGTNTLRNFDGHTKTAGQWASAAVDIKSGTDVILTGRTA